ncbi:hypothetical protein GWN91_02625 [Candidatus Saccharibacteria bacterium]|nr:hypothetical protein [Candidatus Saccharibacteria bacterium]NIV72462.1 hypothetical protein [Calditrichia bacterium]NIW78742.1 hypothetical protein [Calditrichia bacterium]
MGFLRIVLIILFVYLVYKLLKNLFTPRTNKNTSVKGNSSKTVSPPPYDPDQVEDVDYKEVKSDKKKKHQE